ncbi:hypothetical protein [Pseudomonas amygdali]|uniref:Uncharacterized protein n=2 Tax=Pseudomonas amygdali pv. lachrymans TaxID=53707 RepID=A0AAD0PW11_PSEAV|nr:hypothetical protein [Pseudomonas amygdali]AXH59801.1 hypothetical protein PLA107_031755 [Pseudomonas amygdali pv. lachrymans str. M301315]
MNHSNSIEGYCQNPMSAQQINDMRATMDKATIRLACAKKIYFGVIAALVIAFAVAFLCNGFSAGMLLLLACIGMVLCIAGAFIDEMVPEKKVHVRIHGVDMATGPDCLDAVDSPRPDQIGSELGKKLIRSIASQDRKMLVFEKNLVNRLNMV